MKYKCALIAVKDIEASKRFYKELFDQDVVIDYGINVMLSGGFSLQQDFSWLANIPQESIAQKSHNMELYFETDDLDAFLEKLEARGNIEYVHRVKTYDWFQRVVRIYDPDFHIIEIGDSIEIVIKRHIAHGYSIDEIVETLQYPAEYIKSLMD